jgi:hypothetical protein
VLDLDLHARRLGDRRVEEVEGRETVVEGWRDSGME